MGKKLRRAALALLALVFVVSVGMTIRQQLQYRKITADSEEAAQVAGLPARSEPPQPTAGTEPAQPSEEPAEALPEEVAALAGIDLGALRAVNGDVVGWIEIPGTELSYPLLQGEDNRYYLNYNWKKEPSSGGAVFLESTNSGDLTDHHTIVYAHRMGNDSMFGTLKYYEDVAFWREHPSVYIALADGVYRYDIFSARKASVKGIVYRLDIEESGLKEELLRSCVEESVIDTGITPGVEDRILTLSTCTRTGPADRWVVHGYLVQTYRLS